MKSARTVISLVALVLAAGILWALLPGCLGAPHSVGDLATMPQAEFDSWLARVAADTEVAAELQVAGRPGSAQDVRNVATAIRSITGSTTPGSLAGLVEGPLYEAALRAIVLEVGAWVDASLGKAEAHSRIVLLLQRVADSLDVGVTKGLVPKEPPPSK